MELQNPNPVIYEQDNLQKFDYEQRKTEELDFDIEVDELDEYEVFDIIRHLNDPEHPLTLEQLKVIQLSNIQIDHEKSLCSVNFTPTIPHCSMAQIIGLMITVKLKRSLPSKYKINVYVTPGSHENEDSINKQLNDKERTSAAQENPNILRVVHKGIGSTDKLEDYFYINKK